MVGGGGGGGGGRGGGGEREREGGGAHYVHTIHTHPNEDPFRTAPPPLGPDPWQAEGAKARVLPHAVHYSSYPPPPPFITHRVSVLPTEFT